jgi:hypothetical protein
MVFSNLEISTKLHSIQSDDGQAVEFGRSFLERAQAVTLNIISSLSRWPIQNAMAAERATGSRSATLASPLSDVNLGSGIQIR